MIHNTRSTEGQTDKKNPQDFALWKKAEPFHIMRWPSPWSDGFPGWHLECSVMSKKYLGSQFDIHGGGIDLKFPHHECEIAQSESISKKSPVKYWIHANMLTLNGKKMSKSTGNNILPNEVFKGTNKLFKRSYSPMVIRFFFMQAHYRSVVDLSETALQASEKGLNRLIEGLNIIETLDEYDMTTSFDLSKWEEKCYSAMNDDFNSPLLIANLFDAVKFINAVKNKNEKISKGDLIQLKMKMNTFFFDVLGLNLQGKKVKASEINNSQLEEIILILLEIRDKARFSKDFKTSDYIRDSLLKLNIHINDDSNGSSFKIQ